MSQPGYLPRDVVKLTGVPYSTLNLWAKMCFIIPSINRGNGTGHERIYSESDIKTLRIAQSMKRAGLPLKIIARAIEKFENWPNTRRIELQLSKEPDIYISIRRPVAERRAQAEKGHNETSDHT